MAKYHQDLWGISANVYNIFGLFIAHYFTNSNPDQAHASCTRARAGAQCKDHGGGVGRDGGGGRDGAGAGGEIVGRGILFR